MAAHSGCIDTYVVIETDDKVQQTRYGLIKEPKERVSRKGVPDHRARFRETKTGAQNWKDLKEKIFRAGRLRAQVGKFNYDKLSLSKDIPQIRLLQISPAREFDAKVVCDLVVMDLNMVVNQFEALSYCWGTEEPDQVISIRSLIWDDNIKKYMRSEPEDFPVRSNLLQALTHLRRKEQAIFLWVDAICINQRPTKAATAEKNFQLSMMSEIYNSAKNVCIWFGDSDKTSKKAFLLLNSVTNFNIFHERLHDTNDDDAKENWRCLVETLKGTKWFSRRWIIQEIASARSASVHCGKDHVHWDDLAATISLLDENSAFMRRQFGHTLFSEIPTLNATQLVKGLTNICRKSPAGKISERLLNFETLVCTFQQFQASFPQDVIHSVRALAHDAPLDDALEIKNGAGFGLGVDAETSTRDLFISFVRRCIRVSRSLDIICRHWAPTVLDTAGKSIKLPSWISELSNAPFGIPGESHERQNGENFVAISPSYKWKRYNASGDWKPSAIQEPRLTLRIPHSDGPDRPRPYSTGNIPNAHYTHKDIVETPSVESDQSLSSSKAWEGKGLQGRTSATQQERLAGESTPNVQTIADPRPVKDSITGSEVTQSISEYAIRRNSTVQQVREQNESKVTHIRHKRSNTMPSIQQMLWQSTLPPVIEHVSNHDLWKVVLNNAMSPNKVKSLMNAEYEEPMRVGSSRRQDSKAVQESYVQEDKEHSSKLAGQLEVEGFILGTVEECSDVMRDGIVTGEWLQKLGWQDGPQNIVPDPLWRLLVADRTSNGGDPPEWYSRACLHCLKDSRLVYSRGDFHTHKEFPSGNALDPMTYTYLKRVESVIWRRRIFRLNVRKPFGNDTYFGLGPEKARVGNIICILAGCSVPVMLRESNKSMGVFELVGEAYVDKMMNGEAIRILNGLEGLEKNTRCFVLE